ncbi:MAG: ATP-binding cassette domain-containing protein [Candidatus Nanopelagicales bacterium]
MADVINLVDVSVQRGGRAIVDHIDWAVSEGQTWVVLGPNGAGKTTVLQIAGTLIHPEFRHRRDPRRTPRCGGRVRPAAPDRAGQRGACGSRPGLRARAKRRPDQRVGGPGPLARGL